MAFLISNMWNVIIIYSPSTQLEIQAFCSYWWELPFSSVFRQMCSFLKQQSVLRVGKWCILQKTVSPLDPRQRHLFLHNYKQERTLAIFKADFLFSLQPTMAFSLYPESLLSSPGPSPCLWLDNSRTFVKLKKTKIHTQWNTECKGTDWSVSYLKKGSGWALQSLTEHLIMKII